MARWAPGVASSNGSRARESQALPGWRSCRRGRQRGHGTGRCGRCARTCGGGSHDWARRWHCGWCCGWRGCRMGPVRQGDDWVQGQSTFKAACGAEPYALPTPPDETCEQGLIDCMNASSRFPEPRWGSAHCQGCYELCRGVERTRGPRFGGTAMVNPFPATIDPVAPFDKLD
jgi:hypothetical protein